MLALDEVREAGGQFHDFLAAGDFPEGIGDHFAVLGGDDLREFALAFIQQFPEAEDDLLALGDGHVAPRRESLVRRGDGRLDVLGIAKVDQLGFPAKGGIEDGGRAVSGRRRLSAPDPVRDHLEFVDFRHCVLFSADGIDVKHLVQP